VIQARTRAQFAPTLVAFAALAAYGTLRWSTMLRHGELGRLLVLVALAVAIALAARSLRVAGRELRWALIVAIVIGALAMLPVAGFPLSWLLRLRLAVLVRSVGNGLSTLPGVIVPYIGGDQSTAAVIVLGAGLLMLGAALTLGSSARPLGGQRLAAAALPLVVLAAVPSALARPHVAYVHGVILFSLLALFAFSERISKRRLGSALALLAVTACAGVAIASAVDRHTPVVSLAKLTSKLTNSRGESFNWNQGYGPLQWPQTGTTVLKVRATIQSYWKAEDLDAFDGSGWVTGQSFDPGIEGVSSATLRHYTQTLTVTDVSVRSREVIAAGTAVGKPTVPSAVPGADAGTWVTTSPIRAGVAYNVRVYTPSPPPSQLAAAGVQYPVTLRPYQQLPALPSAYEPIQQLARQLHASASTPYAYVTAVMRYLDSSRFHYNQDPPAGGRYPLVDFLLDSHAGYCQQFAGAMALLLRMGGVPVRVAVGFTTGSRNSSGEYVVTDTDAHAWVEVWFAGYGWVPFDPTPAQGDSGGGLADQPTQTASSTTGSASTRATPHRTQNGTTSRGARGARGTGGNLSGGGGHGAGHGGLGDVAAVVVLGIAAVILAALMIIGLRRWWRQVPATPAQLTEELELAFRRSGLPLPGGSTLDVLERRLGDSPDAAAYVAALRQARFATAGPPPSAAGRAAARRRLARELGRRQLVARLRLLLAIPPRRLLH
jgi:protein-glutamine gamma-glutamyltransferase